MLYKKRIKTNILPSFALLIYIFAILFSTLGGRSSAVDQHLELNLFWSYIKWAQGDLEIGRQIILNIGLFAPFGFIAAIKVPAKRRVWLVPLMGMVLSVFIEFMQLFFHLGLAELDDIVSNTLGATIGMGAEVVFTLVAKGRLRRIGLTLGCVVCVLAGIMGCLYLHYTGDRHLEDKFAFELISMEDADSLHFSGYAFSYDEEECQPKLYLTADHLRYYRVVLQWEAEYPKLSQFYFGDDSHSACGFTGSVSKLDPTLEYDLMILWPGEFLPAYTGQHISVENRKWITRSVSRLYSGNLDLTGTDFEFLKDEGELLYWVQQYETYLVSHGHQVYIITEKNAIPNLENVEVMFIQKTLSGDEKDCSLLFGEGEVYLNTGKYRVFCIDIPMEQPLKYIKVGFTSREEGKDYWTARVGQQVEELLK